MLIIDMPMPSRCGECKMHFLSSDGYVCCGITNRIPKIVGEYNNSRIDLDAREKSISAVQKPSWCPIVGVLPETHGRLIDEAVFCENVVKYSHQSTKTIGKALDATPTIIEMTPNDGQEEVNQ